MKFAALIVASCLATLSSAGTAALGAGTREPAPALPSAPYDYIAKPSDGAAEDYRQLDNMPADNPVTNYGATLGRVLFHDRGLSRNGLVACSSCHSQANGFDDRTRFSIGFEGQITERAAMPLGNARFNPRGRYFRDERAPTLEDQVLQPFFDPIEMGLGKGGLVRRVEERQWYPPMFEAAFGDDRVTEKRIAAALAQFVRAMTANRSRYDRARESGTSPLEPFEEFTALENRGKHLFFTPREKGGAGCAACHETDAFVLIEPRNNGLDREIPGNDPGLGGISGKEAEIGLFRAASLKNVAVSAPYMHDGRIDSLDGVIEHYSSGINPHPNLSPELRDLAGNPARLHLKERDKAALVAFLNTLTDEELLNDKRFSNPFSGSPVNAE